MWIRIGKDVVLSREAILTVSPNKQYWGVFSPTNPAATGPECMPSERIEKTRQQIENQKLQISKFVLTSLGKDVVPNYDMPIIHRFSQLVYVTHQQWN